MAQVIFRVGKLKNLGHVAAAASHNARLRTTPNADPNGTTRELIDRSGQSVLDRVKQIHDEIRELCREKKYYFRPDAVAASEVIISASPEYFRPADPTKAGHYDQARLNNWLAAVVPWAKKEIGAETEIVSMAVHLDEATPHLQMIVVPKNHRGELSHKAVFGGDVKGEKLSQWQDRAAEPVKHLGIERGLKKSKAEHKSIKEYYGAVNQPVPEVPQVKTPRPPPLPDPTFAEKLPAGAARAARDELEKQHAAQNKQRNKEKDAHVNAAAKAHPVLAQQAKAVKHAERDKKQAEFRAAAAETKLEKTKAEADLVRRLPLDEVLKKTYGATEAPDSKEHYASRKFDLPDGRQIAITGDKWIEQGGVGNKGAINLVMHLEGYQQSDFKKAVRLLLDDFDQAAVVSTLTRSEIPKIEKTVKDTAAEPTPAPTPHEPAWQKVRQWLMDVRGLPERLLDRAHEAGRVYADRLHNAVFPRREGGAFVRGTQGTPFKRTIGTAECGAFVMTSKSKTADCWICESPIDAFSLKAMYPNDRIIATGGNLLKPQQVRDLIPAGAAKIYLAYDNDKQGNKLADDLETALIGRADIVERRVPPKGKDWNDTIKAQPELIAGFWTMPEPEPAPTQPQPQPDAPKPLPKPS